MFWVCRKVTSSAGQSAMSLPYPSLVRSVCFSSAGRAVFLPKTTFTFPFDKDNIAVVMQRAGWEGKKSKNFIRIIHILGISSYMQRRFSEICLFIKSDSACPSCPELLTWCYIFNVSQWASCGRFSFLLSSIQRAAHTKTSDVRRTPWQQQPPDVTFPRHEQPQQINTQIYFWEMSS